MCHSPSPGARAGSGVKNEPMNDPCWTEKLNEFAGPNVRVSSNCETAVTCGLPWIAPGLLPSGPGITQR